LGRRRVFVPWYIPSLRSGLRMRGPSNCRIGPCMSPDSHGSSIRADWSGDLVFVRPKTGQYVSATVSGRDDHLRVRAISRLFDASERMEGSETWSGWVGMRTLWGGAVGGSTPQASIAMMARMDVRGATWSLRIGGLPFL